MLHAYTTFCVYMQVSIHSSPKQSHHSENNDLSCGKCQLLCGSLVVIKPRSLLIHLPVCRQYEDLSKRVLLFSSINVN